MTVDSAADTADHLASLELVTKTILATISLAFLVYLMTWIPGTEHVVPIAATTVSGFILAAVAVAIATTLGYLAWGIPRAVRLVLHGPPVVVANVASMLRWLCVLAAVVVLHWGFTPLAVTYLGEATVTFDMTFMLGALGVLVIIAYRLYIAIDPATRYVSESISTAMGVEGT